MPRPLKDDPRDHFKTFRFTEAEIARLESRARASGQTLSAYVRSVLLELRRPLRVGAGEADAVVPRPSHSPAALALAEQIRRVGVNLNQVASRLNERRHPVPPGIPALVEEIRSFVRQVRTP
jgi:hypothetical protein